MLCFEIEDDGDRRYRENENEQFRIVPEDAALRPLLLSFARATSSMGALRQASIWCPLAWNLEDETDWFEENCSSDSKLASGIHFVTAGEPDRLRTDGHRSDFVNLWWLVSKWRQDHDLHSLFQQIGPM